MLAKLKTSRIEWDVDERLRDVITENKDKLKPELVRYDKLMTLVAKTATDIDNKYKLIHKILD